MLISQEQIQQASEGLKAIAHELRLRVLCELMDGPLCVGDLIDRTGSSQSNLSQHLNKMKALGVIVSEKQGQYIFYRVADSQWSGVLHALQEMYCPKLKVQQEVQQKTTQESML